MHPLATEITAGITAGAAKTLAFYPLDTLVTRREVGRPLLVPRETLEGARPAAIRDVYAGSVLATLGMLPYALLFHTAFYLCEAALARFAISAALVKARPERSHPPPAHPLCLSGGSLFAGAHGSDEPRTMLIFSPTEAPRLVLGSAALGLEGVAGLYRGFGSTLARNVPYNALHFGLYALAASALRPARLPATEALSGARLQSRSRRGRAAAGALTALLTTPLDLVNTRLQTQRIFTASGAAANLSGVVDAISRVAAEEGGPTALMRGAGLRAAQYAPSGLLFFCVYEAVKRRAASGGL
ncbi:hypothetical protein EMIHUDRAFT_213561 [Emiliania huxleyi CCMP1516]|uniref:Mitochondrial carrier protein n=2 Tax=Emiliania huxleyi TaxID=2903 RepID=A0A0D3IM66_EMIH1|nr:hypothetical protein EMIHUDRAFT_213561 [Emiliania huxleyi CCMP1516]EOD12351.1 hypothetical protein EMIHUDRAFT_213561 [Emiliania huxleyi CCMP1516]|eukprot:XP_005764780.1 hypothetical protein EMIHUDRAFT_213561 [Emiliania huxleyi CCMP1516]